MVSTRQHPRDFPPPSTPKSSSSAVTEYKNGPKSWVHTPTAFVTFWLLVSIPLVIWDIGYCLLRPHSMPGGKWHSIWSGYKWYGTVDYHYGWPAYNAKHGFTSAQAVLNVVETLGYVYYLWVVYTQGVPANGKKASRESRGTLAKLLATDMVVAGRPGATALLAAFSSSVSTVSKTLLYWLQEYYGNYSNIGHNDFWPMLAWILLNGTWIVVPAWNLHVLGEEIVASLASAAPRQRGRPKAQ
ncbi:hypothetical protein BDV19DRAFT_213362 [Aspergillus venezuelensis]